MVWLVAAADLAVDVLERVRAAQFGRVLLALALAAATASRAAAQPPTLSFPNQTLTWSGGFERTYTASPEACLPDRCHVFAFEVALPPGVWSRPGGVQVAVDWEDTDFDLDLHVYGPGGALAGSSTSLHFAQGQAVRLDAARNGVYRAVVVPNSVSPFAAIRDVRFRGLVGVRYSAAEFPSRDLLPDLVALRPRNLRLQTGTAAPGSPYVATQHSAPHNPFSCYPQETDLAAATAAGAQTEPGLPRCLRFDQGVANLGEGPLEIRQPTATLPDGPLVQRIVTSGGEVRDERLSSAATFHVNHGHFHYPAFARSRLFAVRDGGGRSRLVREGKKEGFCLTDVRNLWFDQQGGEPRTYAFPGACDPQPDPDTFLVTGLSPGWADIYSWYLPDQFIDVTGVPAGDYLLELEINVDRGIIEADPTNNRAFVRLRLTDDSVTVR